MIFYCDSLKIFFIMIVKYIIKNILHRIVKYHNRHIIIKYITINITDIFLRYY